MYTIFFTINCVEQLTFSKTFVNHLQFKQLIFFWLKVKLIESSWFPKIKRIQPVDKKSDICSNGVNQLIKLCQPVFSSNRISSSWSCPNIWCFQKQKQKYSYLYLNNWVNFLKNTKPCMSMKKMYDLVTVF